MTTGKLPILVQQTYEEIKAIIERGEIESSGQLPSENILSSRLNVSRATIRTALARLEYDGLILRVHGKGTFIREKAISLETSLSEKWDFIPMLEENGRKVKIELLGIHHRSAGSDDANLLNVRATTEIVEVTRLYLADNYPVIYSRNIFPRSALKKGADPVLMNYQCTAYELFVEYFEETADSSLTDLLPVLPDEQIAKHLKISVHTPIFLFKDFFMAENGHILLAGENYMHEDLLKLRFLSNPS
ncbi:GntR family transcriptional regulator [Oceanispirochaeta crateris]|jgi:DNA-binding GntR family transcriptional regulator|uniref:GntR family transcriptional regulator n=1 Tax=Oceanispirochaeta crateris TaxID=2518645 RepID=A0A5C1QSS1_9SPIO|nr:GntR family transcriptional regulator [Oceanispirochaeta crateris]QEN09052.1 GntR family transcriptional regulator [Oceanispirochaeta crateris]